MSARKKQTPKPRGRQGGRRPKYGVPMSGAVIQMLPEAWELMDAQRGDQARGEYVMRLLGIDLQEHGQEDES